MKRGLLFTNHFLASPHFDALYAQLDSAAAHLGIALSHATGGDCVCPFSEHPARDADFVLFWDKDIAAARRIARHGVPVFNSPDAIRICDSKSETFEQLRLCGVPTPRTLCAPTTYGNIGYTKTDFVENAGAALGFPLVIKECYGSFGEQVYLAKSTEEAKSLVETLGARPFVFQEMISASFGTDIRVNVVGERAVCAMRRTGSPGDFRSNIAGGGKGEAYTLSEREAAVAVAAAQAVGADFAGVDLLCGENGPLVCEVNSNPHFTGTLRYTGIDLAIPIFEHILKSI